jgi:hypothetical protein
MKTIHGGNFGVTVYAGSSSQRRMADTEDQQGTGGGMFDQLHVHIFTC